MNKLNKIVLALFVGLLASVTAVAQSDFNTGGLFYKITDAVNHKVSVVPENATSPYYTTAPSGNIVIPATVINGTDIYMVETIADHAFDGCTGITSIKLSTATPYVINANVFEGVTLSGIKLIVPQAAKAAYKAAAVWNGFKVVGDAQHIITFTQPANGTLLVTNNGTNVPTGTSVDDETVLTVTATANPDYQVDSIKAGDQVVANGGTFTVTDAVTITAFVSKVKYAITITAPTNGTLVVLNGTDTVRNGDMIAHGTVLTVTATGNEGYEVDQLKANGTDIVGGSVNVTAATTITATFKKKTYAIAITPAVNGTLEVKNGATVLTGGELIAHGTVLTATATANSGYRVDSIMAGTKKVAADGTFTVTEAVTVTAIISQIPKHAITFANPANGTLEVKNGIAPITSGDQIEEGTVLTVSATVDQGYRLDSIKAGDVKVTNGGTFTVTKATVVTAFVSQIPSFVITINQPANGTLEVKEGSNVIATGTPVLEGTVLTVSATANTGYKLDSIKVGNAKVVNGGTFTVTEAVTVTAFISQIPPVTKFKVSYNPSMQGGQIRVINGIKRVANGDSVAQGTVLNISVTTNPGYTVKSLKVNGASVSTSGYSHTVNADVLIEAEFSSMTDIENVSATATKVYPNPVVDRLNVETEEDVLYIRVYNMYGVEVARIANANAIDLTSLAAGNYLVRVQTATGVSTHRIVKK
ncbi:MAG: T9SS C-terminal target domain-containing protein [Bacteroidetes bacterium]|nr:MAG: T9SS C-terminal target domain-containing protein [Bacteroidota bacterium]